MANLKKQKREEKKRKEAMNFSSTKASFVAGIVLLITIIKDMIELFIEIPTWLIVCYVFSSLLILYLIVGTGKLDKIMCSEKVTAIGDFLTIMSVVVFVIENTVIRFGEVYGDIESKLIVIIAGSLIVCGAIYILCWKNK